MKKYIATPGAEVIGSAMNNWFISVNRDDIYPVVQKTLHEHGIRTLEEDQWYPHQLSLDIFHLICVQNADPGTNLFMLGVAYVDTARFPYEIVDARSVLMSLQTTYHLNIRNIPQAEGYQTNQLPNGHLQIMDLNPFPHDTVFGLIWGITRRFRITEENATIQRTFLNLHDPDSDGAIYDITLG
jgi:hypothetical protein